MAKALLSQAGYPSGLAVDLYGVGASNGVSAAALALQQMALPAGIKITLRPEPTVQYYNHWTTVPFGMVGWVGRPTVDAMLNLAFRCNVPWNESHWCEPGFDTWLDQLDATVELDKRRTIARKIEDYMTHQGPEIIWGFGDIFRAVRTNVHGIVASPISHADLEAAWLAKS
jgi:peptide/nickel transport system substrate-binding protein